MKTDVGFNSLFNNAGCSVIPGNQFFKHRTLKQLSVQSMKMFLWCHGKQSSDPTIAMCNDVSGTCLPKNLKTSGNRVVEEVAGDVYRSYFRQKTCHATSVKTILSDKSHERLLYV